MTKPDNLYLRTIDEKVTGEKERKHRTNNYYLREISENISEGGGGCSDLGRLTVTITYTDSTTETVDLAIFEDDD